MNTQINVRLPDNILASAKSYAEDNGFGTVQEFIKETVREKLFEDLTKEELVLVSRLVKASEENDLFGTEEELFDKLK